MPRNITTLTLPLPYRLGSVNSYVIETDTGYILVDTGSSKGRADLEQQLARAGCEPGNLSLIILTHGDFDHTGNCAYIRDKYGTRVAMHHDDSEMLERGDMYWNRRLPNLLIRMMLAMLIRFPESARLRADLFVEDEYDLSEYGLDAKVLHIPGHSKGSIGILTAMATCSAEICLRIEAGRPSIRSSTIRLRHMLV